MIRMIFASFVLMKSAPSSASAADAATILMMAHVTAMLPLRKMGLPFLACFRERNNYLLCFYLALLIGS